VNQSLVRLPRPLPVLRNLGQRRARRQGSGRGVDPGDQAFPLSESLLSEQGVAVVLERKCLAASAKLTCLFKPGAAPQE
jgi:hypothetical protein